MNRLKARSMDRKLDQQIGSQINRLKARSKDCMLDHHIEGQINSSATDEADGSNAKDIANKDASKKAAVGKVAIKSSVIVSDPPKEDVEEQENPIEEEKNVIAGTKATAEEKVAEVIEAAPKTEKEAAYVLAKRGGIRSNQRDSIRSVKKVDVKPAQRDSIKPAQIGSTKTASSGRSKPAGNGKSSLSSETGSSNTVTSKLSDRDVLLAQMPTQAHTDMTRPSRARLKGREQDLLKEEAPKPTKQVPMIPNIRIISLSESTLKAQVEGGDR